MAIKAALIDAVKQRQAVLFAGAGISIKALGFAGAHLRDRIGAEVQRDYKDYDYTTRSLEDVCDEYAALNDRLKLVELLASNIPKNKKPQDSHVAAVKMFRFIVTTNWDLLFEKAYDAIGQDFNVLAQESDAPMFNYDSHNLLKIHGSADRPLSLVATTDDYENYPDTHAQMLGKLGQLLHDNVVIFVGHGLRDEHLRRLLAMIRRQRQKWTRKAYAVGFYDEVRSKLLASRGIETIGADADDFLGELALQTGNAP